MIYLVFVLHRFMSVFPKYKYKGRWSTLREKVSVLGVILIRIFPHSDWIQRDTPHLSVFSPNADQKNSKYGHLLSSDSKFEFNSYCCHTSESDCSANQLTGFYMMGTLVVKELISVCILLLFLRRFTRKRYNGLIYLSYSFDNFSFLFFFLFFFFFCILLAFFIDHILGIFFCIFKKCHINKEFLSLYLLHIYIYMSLIWGSKLWDSLVFV